MNHRTRSPLATRTIDDIWSAAAANVGFRIERTRDAYASSRDGVISIGAEDTLDHDDALAQLVFHELCHAITEGGEGRVRPDWGLDNVSGDVVREHACLRVQAEIAGRFGLRGLMAPTTEYRGYHDALSVEPLASGADPAIAIAVEAVARFDSSPWRAPIEQALATTAAAVGAAVPTPSSRHPVGFELGREDETCASCAWLYVGGRGLPVARCRQSAPVTGDGIRTATTERACVRWEPVVDCRTCGACCREAYHSVTVTVRDPVVWKEPDLVERHGHRFEIRREGSRCAALMVVDDAGTLEGFQTSRDDPRRAELVGGHANATPSPGYSCMIYDNRPRPCREFAAGGRHCLEARRRVGLSPS